MKTRPCDRYLGESPDNAPETPDWSTLPADFFFATRAVTPPPPFPCPIYLQRVGVAGKGLYTRDKATGFEFRAQTQQEALELHFAPN